MPPEIKQFNCPQCGSPLDLKNAGKSKSVICPACHSQIDLTGTDYQVVGNVGTRRTPEMTPFEIGTRGTVAGEEHAIIGRVRYRDDEDAWDEWLLLSASGDYRWISEDEDEGMVLWHSFTPTQPVDPNTVHQGATIDLGEGPARVRERGSARIDYLEGELTWKARVGDTMEYIDAEGASQLYSIEWTTDEIEFWRGQRVQAREVATAFGISPSAAVGSPKLAVSGISALIGLVICIVAAFVVVAAVGSGSSQAMELVCNTPTPSSVGAVLTPTIVAAKVTPSVTPTEDLSADDTSDEEPTATPPPNCYYRPVSGGSGISGIFGSIRSGSSGRSTSGSGK
jgi:hypothetical protein